MIQNSWRQKIENLQYDQTSLMVCPRLGYLYWTDGNLVPRASDRVSALAALAALIDYSVKLKRKSTKSALGTRLNRWQKCFTSWQPKWDKVIWFLLLSCNKKQDLNRFRHNLAAGLRLIKNSWKQWFMHVHAEWQFITTTDNGQLWSVWAISSEWPELWKINSERSSFVSHKDPPSIGKFKVWLQG